MKPKPKKPKEAAKREKMPRIWGSISQSDLERVHRSRAKSGELESAWVRKAVLMRLEAEGL